MSYADNQFQSPQTSAWGNIAERAEPNERASFIKKTYLHLLGAVLAFCVLEVFYFKSGIAETVFQTLIGNGRGAWFVVLLLFMGVAWLANSWAISSKSVGLQYAGLGLYVVAESIIFAPLLFLAQQPQIGGPNVIPTAGLITLLFFPGFHGISKYISADDRARRAKLGLKRAADQGRIFSLWTHPENLLRGADQLIPAFESICPEAAEMRDAGKLEVSTMERVARRFSVGEGE